MKDFKKQYYVVNTPWKRKVDTEGIPLFDVSYDDTIIFHFDYANSVYKAGVKFIVYDKYRDVLIIPAINVCLRYYQLIKKLYPHNKVRVIIYINKSNLYDKVYDIFKAILDIIPNFAVCRDTTILNDFNNEQYKHILYGNHISSYSSMQKWMILNGNLIVKEVLKL